MIYLQVLNKLKIISKKMFSKIQLNQMRLPTNFNRSLVIYLPKEVPIFKAYYLSNQENYKAKRN